MTNDSNFVLDSKPALPNKLLQDDGTITDITGAPVESSVEAYNAKQALPNKFLNPDGTYSTLNEIIASMVDTSIYVIVDELPQEGNPQKIYLVPDGKGGFIEYHWTGDKWDPVGMVEFDISNYSTTQEMMNAIEAAGILTLNSAKAYTDEQIAGIKEKSQIFYWNNASTQEADIEFWNTVVNATKDTPVIVYNHISNSANDYYSSFVCFEKDMFTNQMTQYTFSFTPYRLEVSDGSTYTQHKEWRSVVKLTLNNTIVTNVNKWTYNDAIDYLRIDYNYSKPYTPQYNGSPATKKYVDDSIATNITNVLNRSY